MLTKPLHPYQHPGVRLLLDRGSALVAYEMGLGKTPIAIAAAEELLGRGEISTCLLVVPAALIYQWAQAIVKFTDVPTRTIKRKRAVLTVPAESHCVIVDGKASRRAKLLREAVSREYVICSYDTVVSSPRYIRALQAGMVVLDEASMIKSFGSERTLTIKRTLDSAAYRLALTGTPCENRPDEVFSIMEWVDRSVLGPFDLFEQAFIVRQPNGVVERYKNLSLLHRKLSRAMVRAKRSDPRIRKYLPVVEHTRLDVELPGETREIYTKMAEDLLEQLDKARHTTTFDLAAYYSGKHDESTTLGKIMAVQQAIEMFLDHPALVCNSDSAYCQKVAGLMPTTTPKLDALLTRASEILDWEDSKLLIFTRYLDMVRLIESAMPCQSVTYTGQMSPSQKAAAVQEFATNDVTRVFISSHAGAYGTDMRMASHLINYDLPWSGGVYDQINGRHQRVSSEFSQVYVTDMVCTNTIEERKLAVLERKLAVAAAVIDGKAPASGRVEMSDLVGLAEFIRGC
jgi:SNF2 family DNA or RNA helicase